MVGMTTTGTATVSGHDGRSVIIDVTGVARQDIAKTSNYQVKVPYSQINASIRNITRLGGNINRVLVVGADDVAELTASNSASGAVADEPVAKPKSKGRRKKSRK